LQKNNIKKTLKKMRLDLSLTYIVKTLKMPLDTTLIVIGAQCTNYARKPLCLGLSIENTNPIKHNFLNNFVIVGDANFKRHNFSSPLHRLAMIFRLIGAISVKTLAPQFQGRLFCRCFFSQLSIY
jgi:hypothetical protein